MFLLVVMFRFQRNCERASCYARANLPRTVPKSCWSWPVAICEGSAPTCAVVSPNTIRGARASAFICLSDEDRGARLARERVYDRDEDL